MDAVLYQTATSSCSSLPFGPCDALLAACATSIMKFVKRIVQIDRRNYPHGGGIPKPPFTEFAAPE